MDTPGIGANETRNDESPTREIIGVGLDICVAPATRALSLEVKVETESPIAVTENL
jgi:hypothetical protein